MNSCYSRFKKLNAFIGRFELYGSICVLSLIILSTFLGVVTRYVWRSPLVWTSELSSIGLVWLSFLGASYLYTEKRHIGMGWFVGVFPEKIRLLVRILVDLFLLILFGTLIPTGWNLMKLDSDFFLVTLGIPRTILSFPLFLAVISMMISTMFFLIDDFSPHGKRS